MAKKRESALTAATDTQYVRGIDSAGKSIRILKSDLANVIADTMRTVNKDAKGLMPPYLFCSFEFKSVSINPGGELLIGNELGCLMLFQNLTYRHNIYSVLFYSNSSGQILGESDPTTSYFSDDLTKLSVFRPERGQPIKIKNNTSTAFLLYYTVFQVGAR